MCPSQLSVWFLLVVVLIFPPSSAKKDMKEQCKICKNIVESFQKGLKDTHKSNFGGGNTRWEEKSLGTYANSETRLVEIMEKLCSGDSKECHHLVENHEEDLEEFWFKVFAKKKDADLHTWFCIDKIEVCCPSNRYGPSCKECPGGIDRACKGNGDCDGEGTRGGNGKCQCRSGYKGTLCDDCTDNYFESEKNDTHTVCLACHESCKSTCWEAGPKGCDECKSGWRASDEEGCIDINECEESYPCGENQYCTNTPGKFNCATCHRACSGCSSYGSHRCTECASGFRLENNICKEISEYAKLKCYNNMMTSHWHKNNAMCTMSVSSNMTNVQPSCGSLDINECEEDKTLCTGERQHCENNDGSYECICETGYVLDVENNCIPKPKDNEEEDEEDTQTEKEEL